MFDIVSSPYDLRLRVFLLSLEPAIRLASALRLDIDQVKDAIASQYVLHHRDRGLSLEQIARRVGKSRRTIVTLARSAAAIVEQLQQSRTLSLRREIVRRVSSNQGLTVDAVVDAIGGPADPTLDAIELLIEDAFLARHGDELTLARQWLPFDGEAEEQRLDGARHLLDAIGRALHGRFFTSPPDDEAFVRILTFNADPQRLDAARTKVFDDIRELAVAIDADAETTDPSVSVVFCTAPAD